MCGSVLLKILGMFITPVASIIKTFEEFLQNMFMSMLFKFASEHKLFVAVVTFIKFQFLTIFMESPCTWSVDDFLTFMTFVDNVAMIDSMVGIKVPHGVECDVVLRHNPLPCISYRFYAYVYAKYASSP